MVKLFLKAGAKVNMKDSDGTTLLIIASKCGNGEMVETLLKAGAKVTKKDHDKRTALSLAVLGAHRDVMKHLI